MGLHLYRAIVRGHFAELDDEVRARLSSEAGDHDHLHAAFTPAGTFVYDERLVAFSLRYELRVDDDDRAAADAPAEADALAKAQAWLDAGGIAVKHLRTSVTNMASTWERIGGGTAAPRRQAERR